eukprot:9931164-Heterocapsa_arctica.AAC.1
MNSMDPTAIASRMIRSVLPRVARWLIVDTCEAKEQTEEGTTKVGVCHLPDDWSNWLVFQKWLK